MADYTWLHHPIPRIPWFLSCCICNDPVLLETSNTDEYGQAVHEECYVLKVCSKATTMDLCRAQQTGMRSASLARA